MHVTPVLLIILDGFGHREECDNNAICQARKPHWNFFWKTCPHTTIDASEQWVGLPAEQMGNSEVGHLNIGSGRVVYQDYTRIEAAIASGANISRDRTSRPAATPQATSHASRPERAKRSSVQTHATSSVETRVSDQRKCV